MSDEQAEADDLPTPFIEPPNPIHAAILTVAFSLLTAASLSLALNCCRKARWNWSDVKEGVRRGWLQ